MKVSSVEVSHSSSLNSLQANTPVKSTMIEASKPRDISTWKVTIIIQRCDRSKFVSPEPQWRFETRLPTTLEGDENDKIELECSVQDEDAECDWYFAGEVSRRRLTSKSVLKFRLRQLDFCKISFQCSLR